MSVLFDTRAEVASVGRLIARAGLVQAFGHVSARLEQGGFAITSTAPLEDAGVDSVLELDEDGNVRFGEHCPLEAPLHAAVYAARPDVGAICRTHSRHAAAWASRAEQPPLVHGLGGLSGTLALHPSLQLVCESAAATAAARSLGSADCLLLRGNGAVCTAPDLPGAAVRAWFLEERAMLASHAPGAPSLTGEELYERSRHFEAESVRAWRWLQLRFGDRKEPISATETRRNA
jgi:ribulose-5-phosphate 4-epimerase/fuculose-1-phosphate aldolase